MNKYLIELSEEDLTQVKLALQEQLVEIYNLQEAEVIEGLYEASKVENLLNKLKLVKPIGRTNIIAT